MKNTMLGLLCCLAHILGSSSQVGAATFVVNDTSDRVDSNPGNGVCRTSAGTCTLRAAIQEANARPGADIIQLPAGTFVLTRAPLNDNDITTGDLDITAPVTINGAGLSATILDGGSPPPGSPPDRTALDRLFEIHPTAGDVTVNRLTIRKGWDSKEGGALYNASPGVVRLVEVHVLDSVTRVNGGAIYHDGFGGGSLLIERSAIVGNLASGDGGGIYLRSGYLSVTGTSDLYSAIGGNAAANGGGIYNSGLLDQFGRRSRADVAFTSISGNSATSTGGGLYNGLEGDLILSDVDVSHNTAASDGGGVASTLKTGLSITRGIFFSNTTEASGGGVFTHAEAPVNIAASEFSRNHAGGHGGGGLSLDGKGTAAVTGSTFSDNTTVGQGGGIAIHSTGDVVISDTAIRDNVAQLHGGGVLNSGFVVTFTRLTITGNTALGNGGGIDNQSSSDFVIAHTQFLSNQAAVDGGGFHNIADGPLWISDSSFHSNTAENGGGLHNAADKPLSVSASTFWDNQARAAGGGFLHRSDAPTDLFNVTISGNVAGLTGGGLHLDADAGLHVVNTTITRNIAPSGSGVGTADPIDNFPIVSHPLLLFRNSIVAGNFGGPDCHAAFGSEGGNLDGGTLCNFNGPRDRTNVDPGLLDIADNGGPTLTHALTLSSPAVGGGVDPCLATDQRGVPRELDRPCDIGAFEFLGTPATPPPDFTHPETVISAGQASNSDATFAFSANEPGITFECSLDHAPFTPCISPVEYTGLSVGTHTFEVRATDPAGNADPTPASFIWTIEPPSDTTPPETTITSAPPSTSDSREATFIFSASEPAIFECSLDGVAFAGCASPVVYAGLHDGVHTFAVRARDQAGNLDPTAASHTWTVSPPPDTTPPETTIVAQPNPITASTSASFVFSSTEPGSTFQCALDGLSFNLCVSPVLYSGLSVGTHTFYVQATDPAGNTDTSPASFTWTIEPPADITPPQTSLASGPTTPTESTSALFTFSADESGATFSCALDGGPFAPCTSPVEYTGLAGGDHTFAVRATDLAGNTDPTPASFTWTIELPPAPEPLDTVILSGPAASTQSTSATFTFSATPPQPGTTFACALDGGTFVSCTSPVQYTALSVGDHTFEVLAINSLGAADPSPAAHPWTVEPPPPVCGAPLTVLASADAWVDQNSPFANKGSDAILKVQSKSPQDNSRALVRFELPVLPVSCVVQSVTLRLYAASAIQERVLLAFPLTAPWSEGALTWDNQPPSGDSAAATLSGLGYLQWNVTAQVQAMYQSGVNHGFLIREAEETGSGFEQQLHSREKGESMPELVITFAPAP